MKFFLSNLGCKLNLAETDEISRRFRSEGHSPAANLEEADLHVVNSCTVTHVAARDSRKIARRGRRLNPNLKTVLTGCYVGPDPEGALSETGADLIVPNATKERLVERVRIAFPSLMAQETADPMPYAEVEGAHSRALVKVEDGCNMTCSFCIIPSVRGPQTSRPLPSIVDEVRALTDQGLGEVVLTGVQISSYRWNGLGLFELTRALLEQTRIPRIRLSSIAPWQFDHRLLSLFDHDRLCPHFHLSLQSGSDEILRAMRRPYTSNQYRSLLESLRERIPGVAVTTDVIVGFPGESDDHHRESLETLEACEFSRIHAFPYSSRPGTLAAALSSEVPFEVKKSRMVEVLHSGERWKKAYEQSYVGRELEVLWEQQRKGIWSGTSANYLTVHCLSENDLRNRLSRIRISSWSPRGLIGEGIAPSPGSHEIESFVQ